MAAEDSARYVTVDRDLRNTLVACIKGSPYSRYEIAAKISELVGRGVTKAMLDKYTAETSSAHRIPAVLIPAFCAVTGCWRPLEVLAEATGCQLAGPDETRKLEIARLLVEKEKLERRLAELTKKETQGKKGNTPN